MNLIIHTPRLILRQATQKDCEAILDFYNQNKSFFDQYEATKPDNFYTLAMQENIINYEQKEMLLSRGIRYYIFLLDSPETLVGTVSLSNMVHGVFNRANLGYKISKSLMHNGYAIEAVSAFLNECIPYYKLHRIEAYILEENLPSINLINKLNFQPEGIAREYAIIDGKYRDMLRYSYIVTD